MTSNGVDPNHMTAEERLDEVAKILAAGILRLKAKQMVKKSLKTEKVSLDVSPEKRFHGPKPNPIGEGA